jgi:uncharacterized membrane protein YkvA (DUF1232 family)
MSEHKPLGFKSALKRAGSLIGDRAKTQQLIQDAEKKATQHSGDLSKIQTNLWTLIRLVSAWMKGDYRKVPTQTVVFAIAAIVYFLNPFDVVHDYLPILGYIDDAALIAFVIRSIKNDMSEFLIWEKHS